MTELLLGAGSRRTKVVYRPGAQEWTHLVTCDVNVDHAPDVVADLNVIPWPFADESFDEAHAYEVLEHLGRQGDWKAFFDQFGEVWRILKPGGILCATCPSWRSEWAWADPSHTRVITSGSLVFLNRREYDQIGRTTMSDYRFYWKHSFETIHIREDAERLEFVLRKEADGEG